MKIEEAIYHAELLTHTCDLFSSDRTAIETLIEFAENAERYKWHDLRKDPDDLPAENALCVIKTISNARLDYDICIFMPNRRLCWDSEITEYANSMTYAIAWREIEPFEVSE